MCYSCATTNIPFLASFQATSISFDRLICTGMYYKVTVLTQPAIHAASCQAQYSSRSHYSGNNLHSFTLGVKQLQNGICCLKVFLGEQVQCYMC